MPPEKSWEETPEDNFTICSSNMSYQERYEYLKNRKFSIDKPQIIKTDYDKIKTSSQNPE